MDLRQYLLLVGVMLVTLVGCGGRGDETGVDNTTSSPATVGFLLFPNPLVQSDGTYQTNTTAYAARYYAAIDPSDQKTTLNDWKAQNQFGSGTGTEVTVIFRDVHDLGYGRRMTARRNTDGSVAVFVENYNVTAIPGQTYTSLNLDAAIGRDSKWHVGTNAIEFSDAPNGHRFVKFYNFSATTGQRNLVANLDGFGEKAMPGICISCHGGRADPLNADNSFPNGGNTRARLQPLNVDTFEFSTQPGYARGDQEAALKTINQFVLCTYVQLTSTANPEDACRPTVDSGTPNQWHYEWYNKWSGTAAEMIKAWYDTNGDGVGMESAALSNTYIPSGWDNSAAERTLYQTVVAPYCRTCHILRGAGTAQNDIDFMSFAKFQSYADRIKVHVLDRGNMPLALLPNQRFWADTAAVEQLGTFLENELPTTTIRDSSGTVLRPGRPIANAGISRRIPPETVGTVTLSGTTSLFANSYLWSIVSGPGAASLDNASTSTSATPVFRATTPGAYVIRLIVSNGTTNSSPADITLTVDNSITVAPSTIRFQHINDMFNPPPPTFVLTCTGCHTDGSSTGAPPGAPPPPWEPNAGTPPIFYTNYDRGGTSGTAGDNSYNVSNTDDDYWFYLMLRGRINFTEPAASPLLRKPTNNHHNGGPQLLVNGPEYSIFVNWILNGAPYN